MRIWAFIKNYDGKVLRIALQGRVRINENKLLRIFFVDGQFIPFHPQ